VAKTDFFDKHRDHSRTKHTILVKYLEAYFKILGRSNKQMNYFDCFAGIGRMKDGEFLSPCKALWMLGNEPALVDKVRTYFVEKDHDRFLQLRSAVEDTYEKCPKLFPPEVQNDSFQGFCSSLLDRYGDYPLEPSFFFIDPTDVSNTPISLIGRLHQNRAAESLLFFNYEGANRVLGLPGISPTAVSLFGTEEIVTELRDVLSGLSNSRDRETAIRDAYITSLREVGNAKYVIPFRVENEGKRSTSHYLVHASNHYLGFNIMKDVMVKAGSVGEGDYGQLHYLQRSLKYPLTFNLDIARLRRMLLNDCSGGTYNVKDLTFSEDPDNLFAPSTTKRVLLDFEKEGVLSVFKDPDCLKPQPVDSRPKRNDLHTLSETYWVKFAP